MPSEVFEAQAALLVRALPYVAAETRFALKGGTAINVPRLSVNIQLHDPSHSLVFDQHPASS